MVKCNSPIRDFRRVEMALVLDQYFRWARCFQGYVFRRSMINAVRKPDIQNKVFPLHLGLIPHSLNLKFLLEPVR